MSKTARKYCFCSISIFLIVISSMFLYAKYVSDTDSVIFSDNNSLVEQKTSEDIIRSSSDIQIHEKTPVSISFRIIDGCKNPGLRSGLYRERNALKLACNEFTPYIDCMECPPAIVSYSVRGTVSFVEVQNIPPDHYTETVEAICNLLLNYIKEVRY